MTEVPFPLMSEDGDWFAFPGDWTRLQCAREMAHNLTDWYLEDHPAIWIDDDDKVHGWVEAWRSLLSGFKRSWVRPAVQEDEPADYWFEDDGLADGAVEAWVWK